MKRQSGKARSTGCSGGVTQSARAAPRQRPGPLALLVGGVFGAAVAPAWSAGFQIQEQSASGLGVAYAGQAAAVHDAGTVFWNPAGQSLLKGSQLMASIAYIAPRVRFHNDGSSTYGALGTGGQGGVSAWVPAFYASWALDPRWSLGLAVNAPYGLSTEWDRAWAGQFHAVKSEIKTLNLNPTVAYRVSDALSLGAGLSYQQIKATLTNGAVLSPPFPSSLVGLGKVEGDDWGWGYNLGALIDLRQGTRIGATYRSRIKYRIEGDLSFSGFPAAIPDRPIDARVTLPDTFSLGVSHQFNPGTRLLADWTWTGWSSIPELKVMDTSSGGEVSSTNLSFRNSWRLGLGVEYRVSEPWLLRAGMAFDKTPVRDAYRTPRLPDADKTWFSLGMRYTPTGGAPWWIDVGYSYILVKDGASSLPTPGAMAAEAARGVLSGTYKGSVNILAAQAGWRF
ncbi:MAG: OmpP1/FadL family transporter [Burkholderiales bacterium]|nr:OmpP1/FadL family transporter [Burkholderiales bacterium]